ncbi:MAG: ABC transporter permease [Bacteroidetes bacterium]|nr:MAG: ABC transporter permease [Bacteroidota bacterium]
MKSESPGRKIWKRFRQNRLSLFGLILILAAIFISFFFYLFIPDNTPYANRMSLALSNLSPGYEVRFIKIKRQAEDEPVSFLSEVFNGVKDSYTFIPVSDFRYDKENIIYKEFMGPGAASMPDQIIGLPEAMYILKRGHKPFVSGSGLSFVLSSGQLEKSAIDNLQKEFSDNNVVTKTFWLGTDRFGRDLLSRLLAGTRVTFGVGLIAVIISLFVGTLLGSLAGFFRGKVDQAVVWLINVVWSIPTLLLVIAITLVLGKGFEQVFIAVGLTMWVDVARIVRGQLFSVRELEFVSAGKALGFSAARIVSRHMLPNIMGPVLVIAAANFSTAILLEAGLSFLGIGAQPPTPSWGAMIKENYGYIIIPGSAHLAIFPGLAIMLLTMAFTFVANGLRDAMDSREQFSISG